MIKKILNLWQKKNIYVHLRSSLFCYLGLFGLGGFILNLHKCLSDSGHKQKFIEALMTKCSAVENIALYFMVV